MPVPATSIQFNTWYHLALAHYLLGTGTPRRPPTGAALSGCAPTTPTGSPPAATGST
uniref:Uncharacterized protein n=1 Tax=Phenylobacterium glaciei TaxID=2803784 RepID=A0A974P3Y7_9CAUL|nr:hypothetical protein JKL49_25665 [Phenylobacterium glaciei]